MIQFATGSIFNGSAEAIVNPINCYGVSGAGLAREFKQRFPANDLYIQTLVEHLTSGELYPFFSTPIILNVPTKTHWRSPSQLRWINVAAQNIREFAESADLISVGVPALGCGLGGLAWSDVRRIFEREFTSSPVCFLCYFSN